ncbi:MAG: methylmalonyl Co-A mutase-associated GTPase MeaB [Candidatus Promineifilaceae bacterium]
MTNALVEGVLAGRWRAIARLISQVEDEDPAARPALAALYPHTGRAHIVGVTGPPGSGKSSLVNRAALVWRAAGQKVGIVAVDPSSPFSGGALLGDRVRMRDLAGDAGIFIRSMASRGHLGGLARTTGEAVRVLDAAGFGIILVETVGAGQAEVEVAAAAHTTLVVEAPGMGDDIQANKAGILEIADILVVNKADRPGAEQAAKALRAMLRLGLAAGRGQGPAADGAAAGWTVPVLQTVATAGQGVEALAQAVEAHGDHLKRSGGWQARELARSRAELTHLLQARLLAEIGRGAPADVIEEWVAAVAQREIDPYSAADSLFERLQA